MSRWSDVVSSGSGLDENLSRVVHSTEVELKRKLSKATDLDMIIEVLVVVGKFKGVTWFFLGAPRVLKQNPWPMFPPPLCLNAKGGSQLGFEPWSWTQRCHPLWLTDPHSHPAGLGGEVREMPHFSGFNLAGLWRLLSFRSCWHNVPFFQAMTSRRKIPHLEGLTVALLHSCPS